MELCVISSKSHMSTQNHAGKLLQGGRKELRNNHMMPCFQGEPHDVISVKIRIFREVFLKIGKHSQSSGESNYCRDPKLLANKSE